MRLGREDDTAVGRQNNRALFWIEVEPADDQQVAIRVAVVGQQLRRLDHQRLVFDQLEAVVARARRVVERDHIDHHVAQAGAGTAVAGLVNKSRFAQEAGGRREDHPPLAVDFDAALFGIKNTQQRHRVAFDLDIVARELACLDHDRHFKPGREFVVARARAVVHRGDLDLDVGHRGAAGTIRHGVAESRSAVVVTEADEQHIRLEELERRHAVGASGAEADARDIAYRVAVGIDQWAKAGDAQGVAVDIGVVGQQRRDRDRDHAVFLAVEEPVRAGRRRVVDRAHDHPRRRGRLPPAAVGDGVVKEGVAVEIGPAQEGH